MDHLQEYYNIYDDRDVNIAATLQDYQKLIRNVMNINTDNNKLFIWHSTGRGKTLSSLSISEPYSKYLLQNPSLNGYIYVIGSNGSNENFINELTGKMCNIINEILPGEENIYITSEEKDYLLNLQQDAQKNQNVMFEYKKAYKKIIHNRLFDAKYRFFTYQKFLNTELENMENSLIIIDEAHNMLNNNEYASTLKKLIDKTENYKIVLLSATPMFNSPYDIVQFVNLMFKTSEELDFFKVFQDRSEDVKILPTGLQYLKDSLRGKISFLTATNDDRFPTRIDVGEVPFYLKDTKLIRVPMSELQLAAYRENYSEFLTQDLKNIMNSLIPSNGQDLELRNLSKYSGKYAKFVEILNENHKVGKSLIYHSFVNGTGIKFISDILRNNGYLEYDAIEIPDDCRDLKTGRKFSEFKKNPSEFVPTKFAVLFGDVEQSERSSILNTFNSNENLHGEKISVLIGSQLLRESIDLKAVLFEHILNYQENYSRLSQIIGRVIRYKSHTMLPADYNWAKIYKYVSSIDDSELTLEENEYVKDEKNYIIMTTITNSLKMSAVDCVQNSKYNLSPCDPVKFEKFGFNPTDTYELFYSENEIFDATLMILDLFETTIAIDYDILADKLPFNRNIINNALNNLIRNETLIPGKKQKIIRIDNTLYAHPIAIDTLGIDINLRKTFDHISENIDITAIVASEIEIYERDNKLNLADVIEDMRTSEINIDNYFNRFTKNEQAAILEYAIKSYVEAKEYIEPHVYLILKKYKRYLIDDLEINSILNNTAFDEYFNSESWTKKDNNKKFIGHFLESTIRLYDEKKGKFVDLLNNYIKKQKQRNLKDNPFAVGFLERDKAGNIMFKIRDKKNVISEDMRKLPRGYVCNRVNSKNKLYTLMDELEIPYLKDTKISLLCEQIEKDLRTKQRNNNKNNLEVLWFEDLKF